MERIWVIVLAVAWGACATPNVADPNAVAPRFDRWEVVVPRPNDVVYGSARRVLTDSSYTMASASQETGVFVTNERRVTNTNSPFWLRLVVTPTGADSTRLSITGRYRVEQTGDILPITADMDDWRFVRGIGEAILASTR